MRYRTKYTLKTWRKVRDMTLAEASEKIGVSRVTLINWEKGKSIPKVDKIPAIEKAYDIRWSDDVLMP
ncbi:MAG: helix-turn-helix transcriptional regulator [Clostridiales bacterium]|nr:helix-turn-helix transcriptional regulator [Clostridiales bacterium]MBQ1574595.1 helix-turn-helix transcriptional regulator [Clostridiales bacterium]